MISFHVRMNIGWEIVYWPYSASVVFVSCPLSAIEALAYAFHCGMLTGSRVDRD